MPSQCVQPVRRARLKVRPRTVLALLIARDTVVTYSVAPSSSSSSSPALQSHRDHTRQGESIYSGPPGARHCLTHSIPSTPSITPSSSSSLIIISSSPMFHVVVKRDRFVGVRVGKATGGASGPSRFVRFLTRRYTEPPLQWRPEALSTNGNQPNDDDDDDDDDRGA